MQEYCTSGSVWGALDNRRSYGKMHRNQVHLSTTSLQHDIKYNIIYPMSKADKTLDKMRPGPRDWRIEDLEVVARRHGLTVRKPGGSHAIFQKQGVALEVSVPAHKPIKPVYVRRLIELIDA